jgi:hypothetical protein
MTSRARDAPLVGPLCGFDLHHHDACRYITSFSIPGKQPNNVVVYNVFVTPFALVSEG